MTEGMHVSLGQQTVDERETWTRKLALEMDSLSHWHITTVPPILLMNEKSILFLSPFPSFLSSSLLPSLHLSTVLTVHQIDSLEAEPLSPEFRSICEWGRHLARSSQDLSTQRVEATPSSNCDLHTYMSAVRAGGFSAACKFSLDGDLEQ